MSLWTSDRQISKIQTNEQLKQKSANYTDKYNTHISYMISENLSPFPTIAAKTHIRITIVCYLIVYIQHIYTVL